jgi:hypothetical protein
LASPRRTLLVGDDVRTALLRHPDHRSGERTDCEEASEPAICCSDSSDHYDALRIGLSGYLVDGGAAASVEYAELDAAVEALEATIAELRLR